MPLIVLASPVDDLVVLWKSTVPPFDQGGGTNQDGAPCGASPTYVGRTEKAF